MNVAMVAMVALLVREYDEAIAFYRDVLGFRVVEDTLCAVAIAAIPPGWE